MAERDGGRVVTAAYLIPAGLFLFWAGFAVGRVGAAPRGRRAVPRHALQDGPPGHQDTPPAAEARTEAHRDAGTVASATLDEWAAKYNAAPVEDLAAVVDVTAAAQLPRPRNVVWQPPAAAAAAPVAAEVGGQAAVIMGWYWHEYARTEHELWGPAGIDGPWAPGSMAAAAAAVLDEMTAVAAAAAPALAAIAAAGMAAL